MVAFGDQASILPSAITERFSIVGSDAKSGCPSVMIDVAAGPSKCAERAASLSNACARTNVVGSFSERPTNQPTVVESSRMCGSARAKTAISSSADSGRAAKRRMCAACVIVELLPVAAAAATRRTADFSTRRRQRCGSPLTDRWAPVGALELVADLAFERCDRLLVALVERPPGHPLRGDEARARKRLQMRGRGRLSDAELVGDEDHTYAVLHEIAVALRRELRLGVLEPFEDLQPFRARECAERLGVEHHDTR